MERRDCQDFRSLGCKRRLASWPPLSEEALHLQRHLPTGMGTFLVYSGEISKNGSGLVKSSERSITSEGLQRSGAKLLPANSILVTSRASLGHCAVAEVPVATNQGFTSLVPKDSQSSWFLYYWMQHNRHELQTGAAGSTFLETLRKLNQFLSPFHPSENKKLSLRVLRDADNEINALNRRLESVRSIKQGMMQELLTGRTRLPNKEAVE